MYFFRVKHVQARNDDGDKDVSIPRSDEILGGKVVVRVKDKQRPLPPCWLASRDLSL